MFCRKCGRELENGMKNCPDCGAEIITDEPVQNGNAELNAAEAKQPIESELKSTPNEQNVVKKKANLLPIIIIGLVLVFIVTIAITGILVISRPKVNYQKQLSLGNKFMDELDYDQAIAAYRAAIEIDPKNPDAYKALAELYIEMNDLEAAMAILDEGINATGDDTLIKMLEDLKKRSESTETNVEDPQSADDYLETQEYDTALEMYLAMLNEDPMNVDAYLGIVEVYLRMGDYEKALEYAQKGYDLTGDERLLEKIEMINSGNITDSKGRTLKMSWIEDGEVKWWHEFTYDSKGRKKSITVYDSNGNQVDYGEYEYDSEGKCTVDVGGYDWDDGTIDKYLYYYDENGRIIREEVGSNLDFWIYRVTEYLYHGDENIAYRQDITRYDKDGNETGRQYELIKDNIHELYTIESDGTEWLETTHEWEYDDNGNVIKYTFTDYDPEGNIIRKEITVSEYDEDGNMIRDITYDTDGNVLHEKNYQ